MHCHCGTNNRAPRWTFTDPCKLEVRPGAREESWLAAPAINAHTKISLSYLSITNFFSPIIRAVIPCVLRWSSLQTTVRRVKCEANFVSSGSKIVKRLRRQKYDPDIIERTIGFVLGLSMVLYLSSLKQCTLTNKAVGTIWHTLSKPPQRRHSPYPRPLWLLVGIPSAFGPELAYRLSVAPPRYFWYNSILLICLCITFLWPLRFCWLLVLSLYKEDYLRIFK